MGNKVNKATAPAAQPAPTQPPALYALTAKGQGYSPTTTHGGGPKAGATVGVGGSNAASWAALTAALASGPQPLAALKAACGTHSTFAAYAVRRGWLAPVSQ